MGSRDYPETPVINYHYTMSNISQEITSHPQCGESQNNARYWLSLNKFFSFFHILDFNFQWNFKVTTLVQDRDIEKRIKWWDMCGNVESGVAPEYRINSLM